MINIFSLIFFISSCSDNNLENSKVPSIESFKVYLKDVLVDGVIDESNLKITLPGIKDGNLITSVNYRLTDGTSIYPLPETKIDNWQSEEKFIVNLANNKSVYRVVLSDFDSEVVESIYKNKLTHVLGDVKQDFIHSRITTRDHVDNVLKGYKEMRVTGIRVPIFTKDSIPNPEMLDYFIRRAIEADFLIFANPAATAGGRRLANGTFKEEGPLVLDNDIATQRLIARIKEFSKEYRCTWIAPFNEDGRPDAIFSKKQMNTIFSSLYGELNGAELIGPCTWGITAGTTILKDTDILQYISIATTHNLGFEHNKWEDFIEAAGNLPVWDSETNHNDKYGTGTRLEVAIEKGVNGIVLYDSSNGINKNTGTLSNNLKEIMLLYLKEQMP